MPAIASPPAAEDSAKAQSMTADKGEARADAGPHKAPVAEAVAGVAQALPLPPQTQAQEEQPPLSKLQAEDEGGSPPAMAALASGTEAKRGKAHSAPAAVPETSNAADPSAGDAIVPGTASVPIQANVASNSAGGQHLADGAQAAEAVAAVQAAPPAGAQAWDYGALPANVAARLPQIDAENAARMQAPARTADEGAAQASATETSPTLVTQVVHNAQQELFETCLKYTTAGNFTLITVLSMGP